MNEHEVMDASQVTDSAPQLVILNGRPIALFRDGDAIYAVDNECPHKGAPLSQGSLEAGRIICPFHGWTFRADTGACETNPACSVQTYATRIEYGRLLVSTPET